MVSAAPSGRESHRTLGAGVVPSCGGEVKGRGRDSGDRCVCAPVEHMLTRGAALALDGAGALHTLSPEGTGSACPLCQAASAGAAGAEPPHPFSRRSGSGAARDAPAPPEGQKLQRADPRKGGNDTKRGFCVTRSACTKGPARFVSLRLRAGRARPARQGGARRHRGTRAQRSTRGPPRKERRREGAERARCDGEQPSSSSPPGWRLHPPGPSGSPDAARAAAAAGAAEHSGGRRRKGGTGGGWCCRGATKWGLRVLWRQRSADRSGETPAHR